MKKLSKRFLSFLVITAIVFSFCMTGYAAKQGTNTSIPVNSQISDNLVTYDEVDTFIVSLSNPGSLSINFRHEDVENKYEGWNIELKDGEGNKIIDEYAKNVMNFNTTKVRIPAGTYSIRIYNYYGDYSNINYKMTVNYTDEASPTFEKEWNGTKSSAYGIAVNSAYTGNLPNSQDVDYYKFTISNPGSLYFNLKHEDVENKYEGWNMELQDEEGNKIIDEYSKNTVNFYTTRVRIPAGTYYIKIYSYYGDFSNIDYVLTANYTDEASAGFEKEWNGTKASAYGIAVNTPYTGNLPKSDDVDYYKFTTVNPGSFYINFKHEDVENKYEGWNIELQDEEGNKVIDEYSKNSTNYYTTKVRIPAGTYYIKIYSYYGDFMNIDYKITANYTDEASAGFEKEWNGTRVSAYGVELNKTYTGNLPYSQDIDYYKFTVSKSSNISINLKHADVENKYEGWNMELQDENGNKLIDEYSKNNVSYSSKKVQVPAGTYFVRVYFYYGDYSNIDYKLTISNSTATPVVTPVPSTAKPKITKPATPTNFSVTIKGTTATLKWTAVKGATSYKVYYKKYKGTYSSVKVTGTTVQLKKLSQVSRYYFKVAAVNAAGEGVATKETTKNTSK